MRVFVFLGVFAFGLGAVFSCAPRQGRTHFDRWAEQRAKMAAEEKAEEESGPEEKPAEQKSEKAPPPAPPSDYSSLPAGDTPAIKTSTPTDRVIRPEKDQEEEVIY